MSHRRLLIITWVTFLIAHPAITRGASGGAQWSRDKEVIVAQKDVGNERWAITLNLLDLSATGNVFFTDGRPPQFVSCDAQSVIHNLPNLTIMYRCFGSGSAQTVFDSNDWQLIGDNIPLPASFFGPTPGPCQLSGASNGPNAAHANSFWDCTGINPPDPVEFELGVFDDGTGVTDQGGRSRYHRRVAAAALAN